MANNIKMRKLPEGKIVVVDRKGDQHIYDDLHEAMEALQKMGASIDLGEFLDEIENLKGALDRAATDNSKLARSCSKAREENTELRAKVARLEAVIVDQAMRLAGVVK